MNPGKLIYGIYIIMKKFLKKYIHKIRHFHQYFTRNEYLRYIMVTHLYSPVNHQF